MYVCSSKTTKYRAQAWMMSNLWLYKFCFSMYSLCISTIIAVFVGDWNQAQRYGSKSIVAWDSDDLVNWGEQRLVRVSSDQAGNTWAPEALWDDELGAFVVYWASTLCVFFLFELFFPTTVDNMPAKTRQISKYTRCFQYCTVSVVRPISSLLYLSLHPTRFLSCWRYSDRFSTRLDWLCTVSTRGLIKTQVQLQKLF